MAGTYVTNEFRIIGIQAAFVLADDDGHLEPGHRLDQEHIQEPVTGVRVRRRWNPLPYQRPLSAKSG